MSILLFLGSPSALAREQVEAWLEPASGAVTRFWVSRVFHAGVVGWFVQWARHDGEKSDPRPGPPRPKPLAPPFSPGQPGRKAVAVDAQAGAAAGRPWPPPPPPRGDGEGESETPPPDDPQPRRSGQGGSLATGIAFAALMLFALVAAGAQFLLKAMAPRQAMQRIKDFADNKANSKAPTLEDVCTALRIDPQSPEAGVIKENLSFLNAVLASEKVPAKDVEGAGRLQEMLNAIETVTAVQAADSKNCWSLLLGQDVDSRVAEIAAGLHPKPFSKDHGEFQGLVDSCRKLVALAGKDEKSRQGASVDDRLWQLLVTQAQQQPQGAERDYGKSREKFIASVGKESVTTADKLIDELVKCSPPKKQDEPSVPPKVADADTSEAGKGPVKSPAPAVRSPDEAFQALREAIVAFRKSNKTISVEPEKGATLFEIAPALAKALDAEVVVGSREGLDLKAECDGTQPAWKVIVGEDHVATIDLTGGKVVVKGGGEAAWNKHWQAIRFMPIGFRRPGQKLSKDDWLVLSQPEQLKLASEKTLHGLFFAKDGSVAIPLGMQGIDWGAAAAIPWTSQKYPSKDGSLSVKVRGEGEEAFLEAIATIGDRTYTLVEPIEFDRESKIIRRLDGAWYARSSRNRPLEGDMRLENEQTRLGFREGVPVEEMPDRGNALPAAVVALLPSGCNKNDAKTLLGLWCPVTASNAKPAFNHDAVKTLEALRDLLRAAAGDEIAGLRDVRDPVELWRYIQRRQQVGDGGKPSEEIDPDLAAVHVLFGLDGLIVAKVKREQLDELLHRISIASLFEGDMNQPWTIDGLGQVSVRVVRLEPAALLPPNPLQSFDAQ